MNRLFALITAALVGAAPVLLQAQNLIQTPPPVKQISPPVQIWQPPRLVVTAPGEAPIRLEAVHVRGELAGRQAFTEIELTFYNPNRRVLEGELQFPLLAGQNIAGFAMDVNGVLREAVPVDKARGQQVFEDVIRTRIDPGLLEVTQGNNFKLRVYPIPAQGRKRVVLRVTETLNEINGARDKGRIAYRLPAAFGETVDEYRLDVSVQGGGKPQVLRNPLGEINFLSEDGGARWQAHSVQRNYTGKGVVEFSAAVANTPLVSTQRFEGKTYFLADVPVAHREAPRALPDVVGLVWDASGSGATRDHGREFALLDAYFRKMRTGEVRLTFIRNDAEPVRGFRIVEGDWHELKKVLMDAAYDGATNLGAFRAQPGVGEYLLFSDGLSNFGEQPFAATKVPLFAVNAAIKSDPLFLAFAAHRSGGQFIDLVKETSTEAAHKLLNAVTRVDLLDGTGVSQVILQSPFPQNGRIQLAGILDEVNGVVPLRVLQPGAAAQRIDIAVRGNGADSSLPAAAWARMRVSELDGEHNLNRAEIRRLGQRFKLVTRETSLIVLDRVEDYARFEILPPPELRADYERVTANLARSRADERKSHLEKIVARFAEKVKWWDTDFASIDREAERKQKEERVVATGSNLSRAESRALGEVASAKANGPVVYAAPRPSPAAPAVIPPPEVQLTAPRAAAADAVVAAPAAMQRQMVATAGKRDKDATASEPAETIATIQLQKWQPDSAYAKRMREAADADLYRIYLDEKPGYANSVAFYLDAADIFSERRQNALAIRILSNLAEMDLENRHILRVLGYRLLQANAPALAIPVLKRVRELSPEEPQSYRDLGLAYAADNQPQAAIDALNEVVIRPWHDRFPDIELVALAELNAIYATSAATNVTTSRKPLDVSRIDPRLLKNLPLDLRAVLAWDADNTDIDLWVTDPNGEQAYYGHQLTRQGGRMSRDFTGGYGPEEFSLKTAKPGKYRVEARYFGDRRQNVTGPTTLWVRLTTHFGSATQQDQTVTLRLKDRSETVLVGEFEIK